MRDMQQREGMESGRTGTAIEHRWGGRIACHAQVGILWEAELRGVGRMRDVSASGAYIETPMALPLYSQVAISVRDAEGHARPALRAIVVRTESDGVGVEWRETVEGPVCPALGCTTLCAAAEEACGPGSQSVSSVQPIRDR